MYKLPMLFAAFVSAALLVIGAARGEESPAERALPLKGKIVLLQSPTKQLGYLLENASIVEIGGRYMVVGKQVRLDESSRSTWLEGLQTAVAWDSVELVVLFDSIEEYRERMKRATTTMYVPRGSTRETDAADRVPMLHSGESSDLPKAIAEGNLDPRYTAFAERLVRRYDTDGDGVLGEEEVVALAESSPVRTADRNGDGKITAEEIAVILWNSRTRSSEESDQDNRK